jgi:hypothetical protein
MWNEIKNTFSFMENLDDSEINKRLKAIYSAELPLFKHTTDEAYIQCSYPLLETESAAFVTLICGDFGSVYPYIVSISEYIDLNIDTLVISVHDSTTKLTVSPKTLGVYRHRKFYKP